MSDCSTDSGSRRQAIELAEAAGYGLHLQPTLPGGATWATMAGGLYVSEAAGDPAETVRQALEELQA